jgi:peptidoglycan/xylan/chitin deacetylase (PgdA/CDA1 family)
MARTFCERAALSAVPRRANLAGGRILCYHSVGTPDWGVNDVSPARFRRQLELAMFAGFQFVPAERIASGQGRPNELAITFDDAVLSVHRNAAFMLAHQEIPWTLFVVSDWARGRHAFGSGVLMDWGEVRELAEAGVTIGSHSMTHPNFGLIDAEQARLELEGSRDAIADRLGWAPDAFAIPFGQSGDWSGELTEIAQSAGYRFVYAQATATRSPGTIGRTFITRFDSDRLFVAALRGAYDAWEER